MRRRIPVAGIAVAALACALMTPATALALPTQLVNGNFQYGLSLAQGNKRDYAYISPQLSRFCNIYSGRAFYGTLSGFSASTFGWMGTKGMDYFVGHVPGATDNLPNVVELQRDVHGNVYAELVADMEGAAIYQDIQTTPGAVYRWSLDHASYAASHADSMSVLIGAPGRETAQPATRTKTNGAGDRTGFVGTTVTTKTNRNAMISSATDTGNFDTSGLWETYTGAYLVPAGQTTTRFTFRDMGGFDVDSGNFLDNISFRIAYPLTYDVNGGTGFSTLPTPTFNGQTGVTTNYFTAGESVALTNAGVSATKTEGGRVADFAGWTTSKKATAKTQAEANALGAMKGGSSYSMPAGSETLYAAYVRRPRIVFKSWDGTTISTTDYKMGSAVSVPGLPQGSSGWNVTPPKTATGDMTITAVRQNLTVTFKDGLDGSTIDTQTVPWGDGADDPGHPEHEGYHWVGWDKTFDRITQTTVVTGRYEINTYTVTYVTHDGDVHNKQTVEHGDDAVPPDGPERDGYEFLGWDDDGTNVTSNRTIHPVYRAILDVEVTPVELGTVDAVGADVSFEPPVWEMTNHSKVAVTLTATTLFGNVDVVPADFTVYGERTFAKDSPAYDQSLAYGDGEVVLQPGETKTCSVRLDSLVGCDALLADVIQATYGDGGSYYSFGFVDFAFEEA